MNQSANTTETPRSDNKRDRRRGGAGRAAVLRRAPSDSDCSGETASLSADSGDRPRHVPPPTRAPNARSRRRGSEWEVLEGLKEGQRFDRRPDVFNGYLHKKRKWPLKGWHKRFFVVDGGILVYARSPGDVSRGRLHGSVDVGLSVISAKARRRRIDIDADEFIYHLRAKTPDVFRTWLNVLKTHRLYRQHLLTFGARESLPKIQAPVDDIPQTDTSSRENTSETISTPERISMSSSEPRTRYPIDRNLINDIYTSSWQTNQLLPMYLSKESFERRILDITFKNYTPCSLCSMKCISRRIVQNFKSISTYSNSVHTSSAERQIVCTDLTKRSEEVQRCTKEVTSQKSSLKSRFPATACFFFTRKKTTLDSISIMKRSKKCTNLVKYKNMADEPPLREPSSKCLLLAIHQTKPVKLNMSTNNSFTTRTVPEVDFANQRDDNLLSRVVEINKNETETQVAPKSCEVAVMALEKANKASQNVMTSIDYDKMTEALMNEIFQYCKSSKTEEQIKQCIDKVVKDLYDIKVDLGSEPEKALFRSLLEYWLRNTNVSKFKDAMTVSKSIDRQSNNFFTKDKILSVETHRIIEQESHRIEPGEVKGNKTKQKNKTKALPRNDAESFEKDRRIQELERLLKNTVYICDTNCNSYCVDKDIQITKTLINNLGANANKKYEEEPNLPKDRSSSSSELTKIQETINRLLEDTAIPPGVAKEFLGAYLDVLMNNKSRSEESSPSSVWSSQSKETPLSEKVEVLAESVVKRLSKSISPIHIQNEKPPIDDGQIYLKDVIDKITTIFGPDQAKPDNKSSTRDSDVSNKQNDKFVEKVPKDELGRPVNKITKKKVICEKFDDNTLLVDLSKYDLKEITMLQDPSSKEMVSITIKLKEKPLDIGESKQTHMTLKLSEDAKLDISEMNKVDYWMSRFDTAESDSIEIFATPRVSQKPMFDTETIDLKPYKSDATSKGFREYSGSHSSHSIKNEHKKISDMNDDDPQCYMLTSLKKCSMASTFQGKKKVKNKFDESTDSISYNSTQKPEELNVFEKPAPRIIDEKFILLLLENLMMLSRSVPTLHKDINNLYAKLKKKHDKVVKNAANIQGLSLLGKIYNEETSPNYNQCTGTQYDSDLINKTGKSCKDASTDTKKYVRDKNVITEPNKQCNLEIQTKLDDLSRQNSKDDELVYVHNAKAEQKASTSKGDHIVTETYRVDEATSVARWFDNVKTIFDSDSFYNFRRSLARPLKPMNVNHKKIYSAKLKQNLLNELELLHPKNKVSIKCQTDHNAVCFEGNIGKEFDIYRLSCVNRDFIMKKSNSLMDVERSDDLKTLYRCSSNIDNYSGLISPTTPTIRGPQAGFVSGTPGGRLAGWIIESGGPLENASRELGQAQLSVQQLQRLLDALELQQQVHHDTDVSLEGASPNVKKDRRKFGLRKKKSNTKCASVELAPPHIDPSTSHTALSALTAPPSPGGGASSVPNSAASLPIACAAARPQSLPGAESLATAPGPASLTSLTPDHQLREDFTVLAKDLVASLKGVVSTLVCERGRLRAAMEAAEGTAAPPGAVVAALRTNLTSALQQNSELRTRLSRIHDASDIAEICSVGNNSDPAGRQFQQSLSYSSSCVSASEFFDAEEHDDDVKHDDDIPADEAGVIELDGDSSSEAGSLSSEEGSASSDNSDGAMVSAEAVTLRAEGEVSGGAGGVAAGWRRRTRLPAPRPAAGGPSLWNLLYKNIGKDLSQISMPVTINEPLNMLQRLCEELEYCELLDAASRSTLPAERAALVAAFAVSAYAAAAHRAASKPFNPLLAETYECVRDDKGFRFLAEQVSHHPPISACHAESARWCFWQEARIKTKFWGKSMEFQPTGRVHVRLNTTGDHYTWNKVTTCVHNLFGGQRWVDQYGDMHITCLGTDITCKLSFIKASSWSASRHEVRGCVSAGGSRLRLAGTWSEALHAGDPPAAKCLWRPGAMPPEHEIYYGFTRFAMELNEMEPGMKDLLPHTDTRFRPDQRALEEGDVDRAETLKHELEQAQRERRRDSPHHTPAWFRKTVENGEETWVFSGEYWKARENGFPDNIAPRIW